MITRVTAVCGGTVVVEDCSLKICVVHVVKAIGNEPLCPCSRLVTLVIA